MVEPEEIIFSKRTKSKLQGARALEVGKLGSEALRYLAWGARWISLSLYM